MEQPNPGRIDYLYKLVVILAIAVAAVVLASDIVIPLAFAVLLSIVMLPAVRRLEQWRLSTVAAITVVLIVMISALGLLLWLTIDQVSRLVSDLPNIEARSVAFARKMQALLLDEFGITATRQAEMLGDLVKTVGGYAGAVLLSTTNALSTLVQIPIYVFLFLLYRHKFKVFLLEMFPGAGDYRWGEDIERIIQGYISGLFLVTLIVAVLNTAGLLIVGIDHAVFFGILSGVLTIIPYVGIIIGSLFPIVMALITKDSAWYAVGVVIVFTIVQFLEGNFITPRVTGARVSINALAAIVALVIGGKLLGIAGMILSIPALGVLKIALAHYTPLRPFVILIEDGDAGEKMPPAALHPPAEAEEPVAGEKQES